MVTIPAPSDAGAWDFEDDYTGGFTADNTNLTAYTGSPWSRASGSSTHWLYNTGLSPEQGFSNNNTIVSYYQYQEGALGDWDDVEVLALIYVADWTASGDMVIPTVRNTSGAGQGYGFRYSSDEWTIWDFADGAGIGSTSTDTTPADGDLVWIRLQVIGSDIKGKAWVDGDTEPAGWQCETTDTTHTTGWPSMLGSVGSPPTDSVGILAFAVQADPSAGGGGATATPGVIAVTTSVPGPTATGGATVTPTAVAATTTVPAPTVTGGAATSPGTISTSVSLPAPTVTGGATTAPGTIAATTTLPGPTAVTGATVQPAAVATTAAVPAPTPLTGATATPAAVAATATVPTPTTGASTTVTPATIAALTALPAPTALTGAVAAPGVVAVLVDVPAAASVGQAVVASIDITHAAQLDDPRHDATVARARHRAVLDTVTLGGPVT